MTRMPPEHETQNQKPGTGNLGLPLLVFLCLSLCAKPVFAQDAWIAVAADGYTGKVLFFTVPGMKLVKALKLGTDISDVAVAADAKFVFAADKADNKIIRVALSDFSQTVTELPPNTGPASLALAPDGKALYVAGILNGSVARMDLAANRIEVASLQAAPAAAASVGVSADGRTCFAADMINDHLVLFTAEPFQLVKKIALGHAPESLALAAGNVCAVSNRLNAVMSFVDLAGRRNTGDIETAALPLFVAATPDGKTLYECAQLANVVSRIDVEKRAVVAQYAAVSRPHAGGVTPDGKFLVVSNAYAPDDIRKSFAATAGPAAIPPTALQLFDLAAGKSLAVVAAPGDVQGRVSFVRPDKLGPWASAAGEPLLSAAQALNGIRSGQAAALDIARDDKVPVRYGAPVTIAPRVDLAAQPVVVYLKVYSYLYAPATIQVYQGADVQIILTNVDDRAAFTRDEDVVHGFCVNGYGPQTNVVVPKGASAAFTFKADKAGVFPFYSSRTGGPMHRLMRGRLIVQ